MAGNDAGSAGPAWPGSARPRFVRARPAAAVLVTGAGLLAGAAAGLPWAWAVPALGLGGAALAVSVARKGRGGTAVAVVAVVGLAACAVVPGGHLGPLWALAVAAALAPYLAALTVYDIGSGWREVSRQVVEAAAVAGAAAALLALPAVATPWLVTVGLVAVVLAFAAATGRLPRHRR